MYERIIETTILKLSIGATAPVKSSCKTLNSRVINSPVAAHERQI